MKTLRKTSYRISLMIAMMCVLSAYKVQAQWNIFPSYTGNTSAMDAVGIGAFSFPSPAPASRLHVSNFLMASPAGARNGFLFRTDGSNKVQNKWQLYTGLTAASVTEKFRLFVPANTSNVIMDAPQSKANMQFRTLSATRLFIQNGSSFGTAGFVGVNNTNPQNTLEITSHTYSPTPSGLRLTNLTSTSATVANPGPGILAVNPAGDVIYVNATGGGATICGSVPVNNVVKYTGANTVCQTNITDLYPTTSVGVNNTTPAFSLDVTDNINVDIPPASFNGYKILGQRFLFMPGGLANRNTFVGVSGNTPASSGTDDTFMGFDAGGGMGTGTCNSGAGKATCIGAGAGYRVSGSGITCIGYNAGYNIDDGDFSTFVGAQSGVNTSCTFLSAFFGAFSGMNVTSGSRNTLIGAQSGFNATTGSDNIAVGSGSAIGLTTGSTNISIGFGSGSNLATNSSNILIGNAANIGVSTSLSNATAIGNNAIVRNSNHMILGDNNINVGIGLSNDPAGPQNKLEINTSSTSTSPNACGGTGLSGLRFRDLTAFSTPCSNPGPGALAVDTSGNVIYVPGSGSGSAIGNYCGNTPNPLTGSYTIPLNNNNYYFSDDNTNTDKVLIGWPCANPGRAKLDVGTNFSTVGAGNISIGIYGLTTFNNPGALDIGVTGEAFATASNTQSIGVQGLASGDADARGVYGQAGGVASGTAYGGYFESLASGNPTNFGMLADAGGASGNNYGIHSTATGGPFTVGAEVNAVNSTATNIGLQSNAITNVAANSNFGINSGAFNTAVLSQSNIGVIGQAGNTGTVLNNIGVAGRATNSGTIINTSTSALIPNNIGIYGEGSIAAYLSGPLVAGGALIFSDQKLKNNIKDMNSAMELISKLRPVTYDFNISKYPELNLSKEKQFGFIAQEVKSVIPQLVQDVIKPEFIEKDGTISSKGGEYEALNYIELIPLLTKALQEQQLTIDNQQKQIDEMKQLISHPTGSVTPDGGDSKTASQDVDLHQADIIVLNQNVPNPFAEHTVITYTIPVSVKSAQVMFYSGTGQLIKSVEVTSRGSGRLNVFAGDLSNGNYSYMLIADGKTIDSKKMIKQQ